MEEDIWEIENNIDMFMDTLYECYRQSTVKPFEKAIKNLIARNKELDRENQALFEAYNFNDTNLLAKILKDYRKQIKNSISKSKIKEIIETSSYPDFAIEKLLELLED